MTVEMAIRQNSTSARGHEILEALQLAGGASRVQVLAESLGVSEETVRRNVKQLTAEGLVHKVHGAVYLVASKTETRFSDRMQENVAAKRRIAARVASEVPHGASLFLDIGATTAFIAEALQGHSKLFVVTNSIAVAHTLATRNDNRVFIPSGELRPHDGGIFGVDALEFVARFRTDFAILSSAAIDAENGFSLFDLEEAKYSRAITERAATSIMAADSSKFGRRAPISLVAPEDIDLLVTDAAPPPEIAGRLSEWNISVAVARNETAKPRG